MLLDYKYFKQEKRQKTTSYWSICTFQLAFTSSNSADSLGSCLRMSSPRKMFFGTKQGTQCKWWRKLQHTKHQLLLFTALKTQGFSCMTHWSSDIQRLIPLNTSTVAALLVSFQWLLKWEKAFSPICPPVKPKKTILHHFKYHSFSHLDSY